MKQPDREQFAYTNEILRAQGVNEILDFIHWMVTIFSFDHMTGENREQFFSIS